MSYFGFPGPKNRVIQTLKAAFDSNPIRMFPQLRKKYGDVFLLPLTIGDLLVIGRPDYVKQLLSSSSDSFRVYAPTAVSPLAGEASVSVSDGKDHLEKRRVLSPSFSRNHAHAFAEIVQKVNHKYCSQLSPHVPFEMFDVTHKVSLEVMVRLVLGITDETRIARYVQIVGDYIKAFTMPLVMIKSLRHSFGGLGPWAKFSRLKSELSSMIFEDVEERMRLNDPGQGILGDILRQGIGGESSIKNKNILRDQLVTLMFAGNETTGTALAWAFYWVYRSEGVLSRLKEEISLENPDDEAIKYCNLPYLEAVCKETLRIYPIVPHVFRTLTKDIQMGPYLLKKDMSIDLSPILLHHCEEIYEDSDTFRPERFLDQSFSNYEFIPFGGAPRKCLGAVFALEEMKIVLGTMIKNYQLKLCSMNPILPYRHGLVMAPRGHVKMEMI